MSTTTRRLFRRGLPLGAVALALAAGGCGDRADTAAPAPGASTAGASSTTAAPGATSTAGSTPSAGPIGQPTVVEKTVESAYFITPSKNIRCELGADSVRCDIVQGAAWIPTTKPASCVADVYGNGLTLTSTAELNCVGDTWGEDGPTLEYGHALRTAAIRCVSDPAALRCENTRTGHGFTMSRETYTRF